jgi:anthranilate phosphoribosyltransferase
VAAAGGRVAKHGNRSSSGRCGAADFMEALGACITLNSPQLATVRPRLVDDPGNQLR